MKIFFTERPVSEENLKPFQTTTHIIQYPKEEILDVHTFDRSALIQTIKDLKVDVLVVGLKFKIDREVLDLGIKVVATRTTNITDHIDYKYCEEKGIEILNLKGEELEDVTAVAEACLGGMIQLARLESPGTEIRGKTLGLWGFGRIARHLERYALAHDMTVLHYDPKYLESSVPLLYLWKASDFISIHASSTPENKDMVKYSHFEKMKKCPYIINSARHWMVEDVQKALENNLISGYWTDLPIEFSHPKAIVWNHSGNTYESSLKTEAIIVGKLLEWLKNQ